MGKANWFWNSRDRRWQLRDAAGNDILTADAGGVNITQGLGVAGVGSIADARITRVLVGGGGTISKMFKLTGTLPAVTAIGSAAITTVTMTGVGSGGVAVGDLCFVTPKAALGGHTALTDVFIPTTNVVNVSVQNNKPDSAGSFVAVGVDAYFIRSA